MDYHYKAFISYRHSKLDMKVAAEIQNRLERYLIPGSIRKEYGLKKIGRIFRDKDELPSTNDLSDYIKNVLTSSEYLICICSPQYTESVWCRRELEFFLQTHDKAHVLTVLAEGDPYKVMPEVLCTETVHSTDENGNTVTTRINLEPLSCDWRIEHYRAVKEELPRLVSALIGCRYADLRQKERKRRIRITTAATAAGIALLSYFIWSYIGIRSNYQKALINQSRFLAGAAQDALDNNDNLLAAQLSLAALPDEHKDRPIVPKALLTLSKAVGAYEAKDQMNFRGTGNYKIERGSMDQCLVSPDAAYLAMTSDWSALTVWDLQANRKVAEIDTRNLIGVYTGCLTGHGKDQFVLWDFCGTDAALIRYSDASVIWHQSYTDPIRGVISPQDDTSAPLIFLTGSELVTVDTRNGEVKRRTSAAEASGGQAAYFYSSDLLNGENMAVCSAAGCVIAAAGNEKKNGETDITGIVTYYYDTGKTVWTPFHEELFVLEGINRDEAGRILLTYAEKEEDFELSETSVLSYNSFGTDYDEGKETLLLIEEGSGEMLWKNALRYQGPRMNVKSYRNKTYAPYTYQDLRMVKGDGSHPDRELAVAATANVAALYDADTGDLVKTVTIADRIVSVEEESPGDPYIRISGRSGEHYYFGWYEKSYHSLSFMPGSIEDCILFRDSTAASGEDQFMVIQEDSVRLFEGGNGDEDWSPFNCTTPEDYLIDYSLSGTTMILLDDSMKLYGYDLTNGEDLWQSEISGAYYCSILGQTSDGADLFLVQHDTPKRFFRVSVKDGGVSEVSLTENGGFTDDGNWSIGTDAPIASGSYIFYRANSSDTSSTFWYRFSMDDGSLVRVEMPYLDEEWIVSEEDRIRYLFDSNGQKGIILKKNEPEDSENSAAYRIDFEAGTVTPCGSSFPSPVRAAYQSGKGRFAIWDSAKETVYVYEADGTAAWTITDISGQVSELLFEGDDLYVTTSNGWIYRYRADNGRFCGMLELDFVADDQIEIIRTGNEQAVISSGYGELKMVDLANWEVTAEAKDILVFSKATGQVVGVEWNSDGKFRLGACPYYSPGELIEKGKRFVGDRVMSDEDKSLYGLE